MERINNQEHRRVEALRIRGGGQDTSSSTSISSELDDTTDSKTVDFNSDSLCGSNSDSDKSIQISTRVGNVVIEDKEDTLHRQSLKEEFQTAKQLEFDITSITMEDSKDSIDT